MNRPVFAIFPLLFICSQQLSGQSDSLNHKVFSGTVVDDSLGYALPSVHLWNESTRMGSVSNYSGEFSIHVKNQDTIVFSSIGYASRIIMVSPSLNQDAVVRLKQRKYEIGEVTVRRFRSYESFKYQVIHLELPESEIAQMKDHLRMTSLDVALEADKERAIKEKLETGRVGFITPLGPGIDPQKRFREKMSDLEKRKRAIDAKFNRELVGDITHLEGDELTEFISICNFSEEYLYETDLYSIVEAVYEKFEEFQRHQR